MRPRWNHSRRLQLRAESHRPAPSLGGGVPQDREPVLAFARRGRKCALPRRRDRTKGDPRAGTAGREKRFRVGSRADGARCGGRPGMVAVTALDSKPRISAGRPLPIDPGVTPVAVHVQIAAEDPEAADEHQPASVTELDGGVLALALVEPDADPAQTRQPRVDPTAGRTSSLAGGVVRDGRVVAGAEAGHRRPGRARLDPPVEGEPVTLRRRRRQIEVGLARCASRAGEHASSDEAGGAERDRCISPPGLPHRGKPI